MSDTTQIHIFWLKMHVITPSQNAIRFLFISARTFFFVWLLVWFIWVEAILPNESCCLIYFFIPKKSKMAN